MPYSGVWKRAARVRRWGIGLIAVLAFGFAPAMASATDDMPEQMAAPAEADSAISAFYRSAEALYDSLSQGNRLQAARTMNELEDSFRQLPMTQISSAEGVHALADGVTEMKRALASATPDGERLQQAAGALRLAADALANPGKPMWLQYKAILAEDTGAFEQALVTNKEAVSAEARAAFQSIGKHYALIRTAAAIRVEPYAIERADSVMRYAERVLASSKPQPDMLKDLGANVRYALEALFPAGGQQPASAVPIMPASWGFAATIGSFIVTILTWAGWRRYRYDRDHPSSGRRHPR
ncbi:sporulation protein YpjB [Cohnella lubricantis]|uniref:Sporulation protein n=1 Tax=Cohnella lubricantis TaxID=2163172 RepID=A0A841TK77_9BACL|nr:sporulation protein YpjB [Cohnella lubricantis]MBB6679600.1 hypothetical protein [Cohnella lubricantis]MBP2119932.1 sporulation protein YpjB [Cohnella lubricantis]